jgi:hypothetical protein
MDDTRVTNLSMTELVNGCRSEVLAFRRGGALAGGCGYELFRRAVVDRDEPSWHALVSLYQQQVVRWCRTDLPGVDAEDLAMVAWTKFWRSFTPVKLVAAGGTAAVLRYLQMCARSTLVDAARAARAAASIPLTDADTSTGRGGNDPADAPSCAADRHAFWRAVDRHLHDDGDRLLVRLRYQEDLRPAAIHAIHPDLFPSVTEVYRRSRLILDRLRRCAELRRWYAAPSTAVAGDGDPAGRKRSVQHELDSSESFGLSKGELR